METEALAIQKDLLRLGGEIHQCLEQEFARIAREASARRQVQRDGRNIARRAFDFLFRKNRRPEIGRGGAPGRGGAGGGGFRDPEPVLPTSCLDPLLAWTETKKRNLQNLEGRISTAFTNLYNSHRGISRTASSIALHQFASCVRQEAFPTHTEIADFQTVSACNGGIVEDQLLFTYADQMHLSQLPASIETMGRYSNQFQCQSEIQAVLFNHALGECLERITIPDHAKCDYFTGLFHPVLNAADTVLYVNPRTFRWIESHRNDLIQCLPSSKLASTGYWCHDLKAGEMKQWRLCQSGAGTGSTACEMGSDFIWSLKGENMGLGDCTMCEILAKGPVEGKGYLCDSQICRDSLAEGASEETPFRLLIAEVQEQICNQRNPLVPPFIPEGCGANILPGYQPRNQEIFDCPESGADGVYLGVRDNPACQVSEGDQCHECNDFDDERVYVPPSPPAPAPPSESGSGGGSSPSPEGSGSGGGSRSPNERERIIGSARNNSGELISGNSEYQRTVERASSATGRRAPSRDHFNTAARAARSAQIYPIARMSCGGYISPSCVTITTRDFRTFDVRIQLADVCDNEANCIARLMDAAAAASIGLSELQGEIETLGGPDALAGSEPITLNPDLGRLIGYGPEMTAFSLFETLGQNAARRSRRRVPGGGFRSCGDDDCNGSCTAGMERLVDLAECLRNPSPHDPHGGGGGGPPGGPECPAGPDCADAGSQPRPGAVDPGCFNLGLVSNQPSACWATDCPPEQFALMMGGSCSCRTPGARSGGGGSGNRGPIDRGWCGPGGECPDRGGGGGQGGGGGGLPGGTPTIEIPGGPGGGGTPVIPGGDGNPDEAP